MKLFVVGDSFTYGEELVDTSTAWPYLLANKLGYEVTNLAKPGSGNTRMVRHVVENALNYDIIIIAWSHFARFELADENGIYDIWPGCSPLSFQDHISWRTTAIDYFNRYYNDRYLYNQYLLNIVVLQNWLKQNNKKYLMIDAFGNNQARKLTTDLINQIDTTYFLGWPNDTLMKWARLAQKGPGGHFLEDGHKIVTDKIYEYIRHLDWIS